MAIIQDTDRDKPQLTESWPNFLSGVKNKIKHVFVLMLENRSFDHMLGFSNITGHNARNYNEIISIEGLNPAGLIAHEYSNVWFRNNSVYDANSNASFVLTNDEGDPGHEFEDVFEQITGNAYVEGIWDYNSGYPTIDMTGFIDSYNAHGSINPPKIMSCYKPENVPVLTTLAKNYAVCDHWFSSMPGPTWPNRFFVHGASSAGLDHSPDRATTIQWTTVSGLQFQNGTIYDRLEEKYLDWVVYQGDSFPQIRAINGITGGSRSQRFKSFGFSFRNDISRPVYPYAYTFIEPNYGRFWGDFTCGNSQHPLDDVTRGEKLIKEVYEAILNSPHWNESVLIITYDEHGGFYDHVNPVNLTPPGDPATNPGNSQFGFDFSWSGVRVPAVIVSPWIPKNIVDKTVYDHTSILKTTETLFGLKHLTERDAHANSFLHLFSLKHPRTDAQLDKNDGGIISSKHWKLPDPPSSGFHCLFDKESGMFPDKSMPPPKYEPSSGDNKPINSLLRGFLYVAFLRDYEITPVRERPQLIKRYQKINTKAEACQYIYEVEMKLWEKKE